MAAPLAIIAVPPAPAKNPVVPATPMVVNPAAKPNPITGAKRPPLNPITSPPPTVARPSIINRLVLAAFRLASRCSFSVQFCSFESCISNASVTRFSNLHISSQETPNINPTRSNSTRARAS